MRAGLHDLTVAWSAPASSNGVISGYRLFYDTPDSDAYNEVELPADNFEFVAMHLDPGFTYRYVERHAGTLTRIPVVHASRAFSDAIRCIRS